MRCSFLFVGCLSIVASAIMSSACSQGAAALNENESAGSVAASNSNRVVQAADVPKPAPTANLPPASVDPAFKACNPYYPLVPGSHLLYTIKRSGGPVGEVVVTISGEKGKKEITEVSKRLSVRGLGSGLETTTRKYVCDGEKVEVVSDQIEATNPQGTSGQFQGKFPPSSLVMMAPAALTPGATWSYTMQANMKVPQKPDPKDPKAAKATSTQNKNEIKYVSKQDTIPLSFEVKGNEDITVPAGTFHTIRVGVKVKDKTSDEYYAPGIGMVRRSLSDGTVWELSEYNGLTPQDK
ncbi:MAG TPA: hypothetical protein VI756_30785 [Blastocatellia bacterium]